MKFVALALALLLAVGSQAASLQADAPSQLAHFRSAMDVYLTQLKDSAKRALDQLDDTEYKDLKTTLSQHMDNLHNQLKTLQINVAPVTDNVVNTIADATADFRTSVMNDIETMKASLEPQREKLHGVLVKHMEEYRAKLEPIITEYSAKCNADADTLRTKVEPIAGELHAMVANNVEETKAALMPIVEAVRTKLAERLESLKQMVTPYVEEYKEQLRQAYSQAQSINTDELTALKEKIAPLAEEIKTKFQEILEAVAAAVNKQ